MITLEELVIARQTGEMLREQGVDPLSAITSTSNPKQEPGMIKAQDGLEVKEKVEVEVKEKGEKLPQLNVAGIPIPRKIFGLNVGTQSAESFSGSSMEEEVYDPNKHKMKPTEMRDLIKQITVKGMMLKKEDKEIVDMINATIAKAGYSPNELAADKIKSKAIREKSSKVWVSYYSFLKQSANLNYGYALTVHKSQGSTYENVFLIESDLNFNRNIIERNRIKYTGYTRCSKKLIVVT